MTKLLTVVSFITLVTRAQDFGIVSTNLNSVSGDSNVVTHVNATTLSNEVASIAEAVTAAGISAIPSDHAALSTNLRWSASGHYGTPARLAGFFEGGMAGYSYLGTGLYFGGSDELCVSNEVIDGAKLGATAVQTEADTRALAVLATNRVTVVWLSSNIWMEGDSVGTNWNVWATGLQNNTNVLVISGAGTTGVNGDYFYTGSTGYGERWYTNANGCSISVEDSVYLSFYSGWPAAGGYQSANTVPPFLFTETIPDATEPAPSSAWATVISTNFLFRFASTSNVIDQINAYMATQTAKAIMTNAAAFFWFYERAGWTPISHTEPLLTPDPHPMYLSTGSVANASVSSLRVSSLSGSNWVEVAEDGITYRYSVTDVLPTTNVILSADFQTRFNITPPTYTNVFPWTQVVDAGTWSGYYDGNYYVYLTFNDTVEGMSTWQGECGITLTNGTTLYSTSYDYGTAVIRIVESGSSTVTSRLALATEAYVTNNLARATNNVPAVIAAYVFSNSVAQLVIYTNVSGVATSWRQVATGVTNSGTFAQVIDGAITNNLATQVTLGGVTYFGTNTVALGSVSGFCTGHGLWTNGVDYGVWDSYDGGTNQWWELLK